VRICCFVAKQFDIVAQIAFWTGSRRCYAQWPRYAAKPAWPDGESTRYAALQEIVCRSDRAAGRSLELSEFGDAQLRRNRYRARETPSP